MNFLALLALTVTFDSNTGLWVLVLVLVMLTFRPELGRAIDRLDALGGQGFWTSLRRNRQDRNGE